MQGHITVWGQDPMRHGLTFRLSDEPLARAWCEKEAPRSCGYAFLQRKPQGKSGPIELYSALKGKWS